MYGNDTSTQDGRSPCLGVRISCLTGRKTFIYWYRPPGCRHATKRILDGISTLKEARTRVSGVKAEMQQGTDPLPKAPARVSVAAIAERFMAFKDPKNVDCYNIKYRILPAFGAREAESIKTHEVTAWHKEIGRAHV